MHETNPEQPVDTDLSEVENERDVFTFLRAAIESDPSAPLDDRLLGLSGILINLGQKDKAIKIIDEVINRGAFFSRYENKQGYAIAGRLLGDAGDIRRAREMLSIYAADLVRSNDTYNKETYIRVSRDFSKYGLKDEARKVLLKAKEWQTTLHSVEVRRQYASIMDLMIELNCIDDAKALLIQYEQLVADYARPEQDREWYGSVLIDGYINLARWTKILQPQSQKALEYANEAVNSISNLDPEFGKDQPFPVAEMMANMAEAGFEDKIAPFAQLLDGKDNLKRGYMFVACEYVKQGKKDLVEQYYQKAQAVQVTTKDLNEDTWTNQIRVLTFLKKQEDIDALFEEFDTMVVNYPKNVGSPWNVILEFVSVLAKVGLGKQAENYLQTRILHGSNLNAREVERVADAIGKQISPEFLISLLSSVKPTERLQILLGHYKFVDKYNFQRFAPFLSGVPESLDPDTLQKYLILSVEPKAWKKVVDSVRAQTPSDNQAQLADSIRFCLLEYGNSNRIDAVFSVLPYLKEKLSFDRMDGYRTLTSNQNVIDVLGVVKRRNAVIALAKAGVITETKHLLYLDSDAMDRLSEILKTYESEGKSTSLALEFMSRILKQRTVSTSSVILCTARLKLDLTERKTQEDILEALDSLGGITPILFDQFRRMPPEKKQLFIQGVKKLRDTFYRNTQLDPSILGLQQADFDKLLAEYITLLYKPVGFSADTVEDYIQNITRSTYQRDMTKELTDVVKMGGEHWDQEKGCYIVDIDVRDETYVWKEGKSLDEKTRIISNMVGEEIPELITADKETLDKIRTNSIVTLIKQGKTIQPHDARSKVSLNEEKMSVLASLLSLLPEESLSSLYSLHAAIATDSPTLIRQSLQSVREIVGARGDQGYNPGVILHDKWRSSAKTWMEGLSGTLQLDIFRALGTENLEKAIDSIYEMFQTNLVAKVSDLFAKEENKMTVFGSLNTGLGKKRVRFYVSKNIPSFFAKASAGICTAQDIGLFTRKDHFHINMVDDESENVIGNIQAYLLPTAGNTSLLLRGINPTSAFLTRGNARGIIEAALTVGQELMESSNFASLALSESLGGYHAHSNRPEVGEILINDYLVKDKEVTLPEPFEIAEHARIERIYRVVNNPNVKINTAGNGRIENALAWLRSLGRRTRRN